MNLKCPKCGESGFSNKKSLSGHTRWHNPNMNYNNRNGTGGRKYANAKNRYKCSTTGYIILRDENGRLYKEHREVMENHIGRKLKEEELVHHINGIKDDNRIENLQIMSFSEHARKHGKEHCNFIREKIIPPEQKRLEW